MTRYQENEDVVIAQRVTDHRVILGSRHPVTKLVERVSWPGRRAAWRVTFGICNGVAGGSIEYRLRRDAMAEFNAVGNIS